MALPKLQHRYLKIDGSSSTEPPRLPPDQEPPSLADKFASAISKSYRAVTCQSLRQAFNDLRINPKIMDEPDRPRNVQLMMAFRQIETQVIKLTSAIEAGGMAGCRAAREAQNMIIEGLENLVLKQSLNPL